MHMMERVKMRVHYTSKVAPFSKLVLNSCVCVSPYPDRYETAVNVQYHHPAYILLDSHL